MRPDFNAVCYLWNDDGSLRDIYVQRLRLEHWVCFDSLIDSCNAEYAVDGIVTPYPGSAAIFANRKSRHLLSVLVGKVSINCHFFVQSQLELDISPCQILGETEHDAVLDFVERLSLKLGCPVDITPENSEENPILTYSPTAKSWHVHLDGEGYMNSLLQRDLNVRNVKL